MKGLFVTATDTNVGKTWVGTQLVAELIKQKINVQARKPIESGWPESADISETDAWKLAATMNKTDALDLICPNRFAAALSPDRAARLEGKTISLNQLKKDCLNGVKKSDFLFVEGAGGFYSPICEDGLNADLAVSLDLSILLIVEDRLGCINQALLNVEAIAKQGLTLSAIVLNKARQSQYDEQMDNFFDIQKRVDCDVITFDHNHTDKNSIEKLAYAVLAV